MIVCSFMCVANEMKINTPLELDFTQEARNAVKVTPRVLVMYYCTGCQINDVQSVRRQNVDVYNH